MRRVIVLRPEPGASETVQRARERGLDAVAVPLFEVEPVRWEMPDVAKFDGLLLTSANAVRHGGAGLKRLTHVPVYAVGKATADAARDGGFTVASTGSGGVDALLDSVETGRKLLHLCGEHRVGPANGRHEIASAIVYRSNEVAATDVRIAAHCVAAIHSPRAGRRFAALIDEAGVDRGTIAVAAISDAAADAAGDGWTAMEVAATPTDDALLALAERLCNKVAG
jgi:uroporphyrinogen-III synthase